VGYIIVGRKIRGGRKAQEARRQNDQPTDRDLRRGIEG